MKFAIEFLKRKAGEKVGKRRAATSISRSERRISLRKALAVAKSVFGTDQPEIHEFARPGRINRTLFDLNALRF